VDILLEVPTESFLKDYADILIDNGYNLMSQEDKRISLNKGYTGEGFAEEGFHLHLRFVGDNGELYFRDYLRDHPEVAKEYEALKLSLWRKYEHNRNAYTDSKTEFIRKYTELAKREYRGRY